MSGVINGRQVTHIRYAGRVTAAFDRTGRVVVRMFAGGVGVARRTVGVVGRGVIRALRETVAEVEVVDGVALQPRMVVQIVFTVL